MKKKVINYLLKPMTSQCYQKSKKKNIKLIQYSVLCKINADLITKKV
jgi:hypothetical protein